MKKDYVFGFLRRLHECSIVFLKGVGNYGGKGRGVVDWKEYYLDIELYNTNLGKRIYVGFFKVGGGPVATSLYMFKYANKVKYAYGKGVCNSFIYYSF